MRQRPTRIWLVCPECGRMLKILTYDATFGRVMASRCGGIHAGIGPHPYTNYVCVGDLPETHDKDHVIAVAKLLAADHSQE